MSENWKHYQRLLALLEAHIREFLMLNDIEAVKDVNFWQFTEISAHTRTTSLAFYDRRVSWDAGLFCRCAGAWGFVHAELRGGLHPGRHRAGM